jgi:Flp pilus assembly protein TadD
VCLGLVGLVVLLYGRVARFSFVFDDIALVVENPHIARGLGWEGLRAAITETYVSSWHPLTALSHMLDRDLFGLAPAGHHLVNVALHAANSVLLLVVLHAMTGDFWPAAAVAALFAIHPLHVESVAWVSERKDVLSTFFWFLTMAAYLRYSLRPAVGRYLLVAALLGLGLMAKATLVTLPCVLLLLDVWPLGRWARARGRPGASAARRWLVAEKLPLLVLSAAASVATVLAQRRGGALQPMAAVPLEARVDNAIVAYVAYLGKAIWPAGLACFYPHPAIAATDATAVLRGPAFRAALVLAGISAGVARAAPRAPYLAVGWLWYLGTLVPMIGLVQVGAQAMADRYTYVPLVGIFIMVAWSLRDLTAGRPAARRLVVAGAVLALAGCAGVTWVQVGQWRDSETLYTHALDVTADNYLAHYNLGNALLREGKVREAKLHFERAIAIQPAQPGAHNNLGAILQQEGNLQEAAAHFALVLRMQPDHAGAHNNLGNVLFRLGRFDEAEEHFAQAIALQPDFAAAHTGLGNALVRQGRLDEAAREYAEAIRLRPDSADPYTGLGSIFLERGDLQRAAAQFERALAIDPKHQGARIGLARVRSLGGGG